MTQRELERQLSRATGESVSTIRNLGFSLVELPDLEPPDLESRTVDWDAIQAERIGLFPAQERHLRIAA